MQLSIPGLDGLEKRIDLDTLKEQMSQIVTNTDQLRAQQNTLRAQQNTLLAEQNTLLAEQNRLLTEIRDALTANRAAAPDRNGPRRTAGRQMVGRQP